jgi:hypothetical protein
MVACRQLGLPSASARPLSSTVVSAPFFLDDMSCTWTDHHLASCQHSTKALCSSTPSQVAGVCCEAAAPLRLADCRPDGCCRLEVQFSPFRLDSPEWGTICGDYFSDTEAIIACRQLGLPTALARFVEKFGGGTGKVWLDDLACAPGSTVLSTCNHRGWEIHNCYHGKDVGVCCQETHDCDPSTTCYNTAASFECGCNPGFEGNGSHCERICGPGWEVDGVSCTPVPPFEEGDCPTGHAQSQTPDAQPA